MLFARQSRKSPTDVALRNSGRGFDHSMTSRSGSRYWSGSSSVAYTTLKMAVLPPMPSASASNATAVKPGLFASMRRPYRTSRQMLFIGCTSRPASPPAARGTRAVPAVARVTLFPRRAGFRARGPRLGVRRPRPPVGRRGPTLATRRPWPWIRRRAAQRSSTSVVTLEAGSSSRYRLRATGASAGPRTTAGDAAVTWNTCPRPRSSVWVIARSAVVAAVALLIGDDHHPLVASRVDARVDRRRLVRRWWRPRPRCRRSGRGRRRSCRRRRRRRRRSGCRRPGSRTWPRTPARGRRCRARPPGRPPRRCDRRRRSCTP